MRPRTPELRESLQALIRYYSENAGRLRYDGHLRLGYGIGGGAVESAQNRSCMLAFAGPGCAGVKRDPLRACKMTALTRASTGGGKIETTRTGAAPLGRS